MKKYSIIIKITERTNSCLSGAQLRYKWIWTGLVSMSVRWNSYNNASASSLLQVQAEADHQNLNSIWFHHLFGFDDFEFFCFVLFLFCFC